MTPHEHQEQQKARVRAMYNTVEDDIKLIQADVILPADKTVEVAEVVTPATQEKEGE